MFLSQPPRSHARQAQGKKERGSFLPFTMETALYPKDCKCSAAVSLPHCPSYSDPRSRSRLIPAPVHPLNRSQPAHPASLIPAEAGLLGTFPSSSRATRKPPAHRSSPCLPFCYPFSLSSGSPGFVSLPSPGGSRVNRPLSHPNQHTQTSTGNKGKVKKASPAGC